MSVYELYEPSLERIQHPYYKVDLEKIETITMNHTPNGC